MADIKSANLIIFKGLLFLLLGVFAFLMLVGTTWRLDVFVLLVIAIWAFCRFYYFAFYVIENYVDNDYKFDGLYSVAIYLAKRNRPENREENGKQ